jgi:ABC-type dipeptide/oligopeptide/nickel transport system ATPase component
VGVMIAGRLIEIGKTTEVFANPQHKYVKKLLSSRFNTTGELIDK